MQITLETVKNDKTTGSYQMCQNSLHVFKNSIKNSKEKNIEKFCQEINDIGNELIKAQPNIIITRKKITYLVYYLNRMSKTDKSLQHIKSQLIKKIKEISDSNVQKKVKVANIGAKLIFNNNNILTISSSTIIKELLITARKLKRKFHVFCLESRPIYEGIKFAEELSKNSIKCTIATDASMGTIIKDMNIVICGADRLYETGFVNKMGTFPLALTAQHFRIPFYLACETDKIMKEIDRSVRFYSQNPEEIYKEKNTKLNIINYHFESIPFTFVSKIICEDGVFETNEFINWYLKD